MSETCPFCGSSKLIDRLCKVWCATCKNLVRTCSDL